MLNFLFSMALLFYFCFCFAKSTLVKKDQHLIKLKGNIKTQCLKTSLKSPKESKMSFFQNCEISARFLSAGSAARASSNYVSSVSSTICKILVYE